MKFVPARAGVISCFESFYLFLVTVPSDVASTVASAVVDGVLVVAVVVTGALVVVDGVVLLVVAGLVLVAELSLLLLRLLMLAKRLLLLRLLLLTLLLLTLLLLLLLLTSLQKSDVQMQALIVDVGSSWVLCNSQFLVTFTGEFASPSLKSAEKHSLKLPGKIIYTDVMC